MLDQSIVKIIYDSVFKKIKRKEIDLFLCGGASTSKRRSYRDTLRDQIRDMKNLSIYYPEDMFSEILARKKTDLLTLEKILADNSDIVLIICESPGSFTELGAFVNNSDTCGKVVAFIQSKYKNDKSFINQGPIEYLKNHSDRKTKVSYFNTDIESIKKEAKTVLNETSVLLERQNARYELGQISGLECFIILLLFFFDIIKYEDLRSVIREQYISAIKDTEELNEKGNSLQFETIYYAAIKRLYRKGYLIKREDLEGYKLSVEGYLKVKSYLKYNYEEDKRSALRNEKFIQGSDKKRNIRDRFTYVDGIRLETLRKSFYRHG